MICLCIYFVFTKNAIILSIFEIDTFNFTIHILTILTCSLKTYVVRLHNLISMDIFFTIEKKNHRFYDCSCFMILKRNQNQILMNIFFTIKIIQVTLKIS